MAEVQKDWREKWYDVAKAVAYELRPFALPTKQDLRDTAQAVKTNAQQLGAEAKRLVPEIVELVKGVRPLRVLAVCSWLFGWAGFIWLEFGAVYFIVSAMAMIFVNLGERGEDEGEWSAYSVFNAGCRALLGTINAEQFEREIMRQNPAAPDHDHEDEYVWVEPPGMRDAAAAAVAGDFDEESENGSETDPEEEMEAEEINFVGGLAGDGGGGVGGVIGGARGGRKVSGKRARRGFEERRERQEERRLALEALGQDEWD